jgi:inorganic pyrophosphatase/exopolyphosphatase
MVLEYLRKTDQGARADLLEKMINEKRVWIGPFELFLAANYTNQDKQEIMMVSNHEDIVKLGFFDDLQLGATLVHEIGAMGAHRLDDVQNTARHRKFIRWYLGRKALSKWLQDRPSDKFDYIMPLKVNEYNSQNTQVASIQTYLNQWVLEQLDQMNPQWEKEIVITGQMPWALGVILLPERKIYIHPSLLKSPAFLVSILVGGYIYTVNKYAHMTHEEFQGAVVEELYNYSFSDTLVNQMFMMQHFLKEIQPTLRNKEFEPESIWVDWLTALRLEYERGITKESGWRFFKGDIVAALRQLLPNVMLLVMTVLLTGNVQAADLSQEIISLANRELSTGSWISFVDGFSALLSIGSNILVVGLTVLGFIYHSQIVNLVKRLLFITSGWMRQVLGILALAVPIFLTDKTYAQSSQQISAGTSNNSNLMILVSLQPVLFGLLSIILMLVVLYKIRSMRLVNKIRNVEDLSERIRAIRDAYHKSNDFDPDKTGDNHVFHNSISDLVGIIEQTSQKLLVEIWSSPLRILSNSSDEKDIEQFRLAQDIVNMLGHAVIYYEHKMDDVYRVIYERLKVVLHRINQLNDTTISFKDYLAYMPKILEQARNLSHEKPIIIVRGHPSPDFDAINSSLMEAWRWHLWVGKRAVVVPVVMADPNDPFRLPVEVQSFINEQYGYDNPSEILWRYADGVIFNHLGINHQRYRVFGEHVEKDEIAFNKRIVRFVLVDQSEATRFFHQHTLSILDHHRIKVSVDTNGVSYANRIQMIVENIGASALLVWGMLKGSGARLSLDETRFLQATALMDTRNRTPAKMNEKTTVYMDVMRQQGASDEGALYTEVIGHQLRHTAVDVEYAYFIDRKEIHLEGLGKISYGDIDTMGVFDAHGNILLSKHAYIAQIRQMMRQEILKKGYLLSVSYIINHVEASGVPVSYSMLMVEFNLQHDLASNRSWQLAVFNVLNHLAVKFVNEAKESGLITDA